MERALYGPDGFYRREQPAAHFRTSAHASPLFAQAVAELGRRVAAALGQEEITLVDVGAGGGELLTALASSAPAGWRLVAVELRPRPDGLPARIEWTDECEYGVQGLLIANELLDNVPVDVVTFTPDGWRQVLVDSAGGQRTGGPADADHLHWLERWWPEPADGDVVEVGTARDRLWAHLATRLDAGLAVAVDYGLEPARHRRGTLTGYREGHQTPAVPDGSCDLTAHVQLRAVAAAGEAAGLQGTQLRPQGDVLASLGVSAARPPLALATDDPAGYLAALSSASHAAELLDPDGLGGFEWLLQGRGVEPAVVLGARAATG
jgi:SAM-dependent MidA family methyltransferase